MKKSMIYVVSHKMFDTYFIPRDNYSVIFVGKGNNVGFKDPFYIHDNTLNNISEKNYLYCELTASYWVYKNIDNYDYIGICHYRRYFTSLINYFCYTRFLFKPRPIDNKRIINYLKNNDIILPLNKCSTNGTVYSWWVSNSKTDEDLILLKNAISKISPEYLDAYDIAMNSNYFYQCNMFICKKDLFKEFFKWEYSILSEMEIHTTKPRILGYIGEIMTNIYVIKNKLKIKKLPILTIGETKRSHIKHFSDI